MTYPNELDLAKMTLMVGWDPTKLFLDRVFELEFEKSDLEALSVLIKERIDSIKASTYDGPVDSAYLIECFKRGDIPDMNPLTSEQSAVLLSVAEPLLYKLLHTSPVEINRDDFELICGVLQMKIDALIKTNPDLILCLAELAKRFMGVEDLSKKAYLTWLGGEAQRQLKYLEGQRSF